MSRLADVDWSKQDLQLADRFVELGKAGYEGKCFTINGLELAQAGGALKLPSPDYEHRIYSDRVTDNLIVVRPSPDGSWSSEFKYWSRMR